MLTLTIQIDALLSFDMEGETPEELYASIFEMALQAPGTGSLLQAGIVGSASEGRYSVLLGLDVGFPGAETNLARTHWGRSM